MMDDSQTHRPGLRRVAMDLHLHTPASEDWQGGEVSAEQIVQQAMDRGLSAIAVTDHQTGAWVDRVKAAAEGTDLVIFPGIEINNLGGNEGIHLVALFDVDATSKDLENFLAAIRAVRGAGEGRERSTARMGMIETLEQIREYGGIAVLAHCQSSKGALGEMRGDVRKELVRHPTVLAAEAHAEDFWDQEKEADHKRVYDYLDGTDPIYRRKLAVFQSSDNPAPGDGHGHAVEGIGTRYTYFYVEDPIRLESLRQCFIDREVRITFPPLSETSPEVERRTGFPQIARVRVTGGFLDGLDLPLHAGLNTLIGPKGSGKSLLMEFVRFALDQQPTQPAIREDHETKLQKQLLPYGKVEVVLRDAAGDERSIVRTYDPANGNPFDDDVHPSELFVCHLLSQGEIVRLAESEEEQIRFIDSFFDFRSHQRAISETKEQIQHLDSQVSDQIRARKKAAGLRTEIKTLDERLATIDKELKSDAFADYRAAKQKASAAESLIRTFDDLEEIAGAALSRANVVAVQDVPEELAEDPLLRRLREQAESSVAETRKDVDAIRAAIRKAREAAINDRDQWLPTLRKAEERHNEAVAAAGGDVVKLSQERGRLANRRDERAEQLRKASGAADQLAPTVERRNELLAQLEQQENAYSEERRKRCDWFFEKSGEQIKASVQAGSNVEAFRHRLEALKRGSYLSDSDIEAIAQSVRPDRFVNSLLRYDLTAKPSDLDDIVSPSGLNAAAIQKLADFLLESCEREELLALQYRVTPTDRPLIEFRLPDGDYHPLSELSTGQKSTALLIMTLCEGTAPILVDQPEDSLDIRSIWDDMCLRLRTSKTTRQFIFTTHNSSLAVASDTDKFIVLAPEDQRGKVILSGAIDSERVRRDVIKLLEGGPDTYHLKRAKYDLTDRSAEPSPDAPDTPDGSTEGAS